MIVFVFTAFLGAGVTACLLADQSWAVLLAAIPLGGSLFTGLAAVLLCWDCFSKPVDTLTRRPASCEGRP